MNLATCQWDAGLLNTFRIPADILPEIKNTSDDYGSIVLPELAMPIKLGAMIGDQQAAYLALRQNQTPATGLINLGTGGFLLLPTGASPQRFSGLLTGVLSKTQGTTEYMLEGTVTSIQGIFLWLKSLGLLKNKDRFSPPENSEWEHIPLVVGSFGGLASPYWRGDVKVQVLGLDHTTNRNHILKGFLLGMAHLFWEILLPLKGTAFEPSQLIASGGLSKSPGLLQILSQYLELPIRPVSHTDLTALGACLAASQEKLTLPIDSEKALMPHTECSAQLETYRNKAQSSLKAMLSESKV